MRTYFYDVQEQERVIFTDKLHDLVPTYIEKPLTLDTVHADAEIISVFITSTVTKELLDAMPHLKLIALRSTGFDHVDMEAVEERGVVLVNVPSYGENTIAEYAFGLLLSLTRKISLASSVIKDTSSQKLSPEYFRGLDVFGKTIGVIGAGRIGRRMIGMAKGFGMRVIVHDVYEDAQVATSLGFTYVSAKELFAQSDVISFHTPSTPANHHMLSRDIVNTVLKKGVYIINTSRGDLIDTEALIEGLEQGIIAGAGLDVCEGEVLLRGYSSTELLHTDHTSEYLKYSAYIGMLKAFPNVILTPHIAYNTQGALVRICETTIGNITSFIHGAVTNRIQQGVKPVGKLILMRHTQSEWNALGVWTGTRDKHLTDKGFEDARLLGLVIEDIHIDHAFASTQVRTIETLSSVLGTMRQLVVPITRSSSLNERDYGEYTGKNKHDMKELLGEEQFEHIRRGWDVPIPHGETLKAVHERVVSYYIKSILPRLVQGENILIVSHGNALRALIKYIEGISDEEIEHVEMMFGGAIVYTLQANGTMLAKEVRETESQSYDHV